MRRTAAAAALAAVAVAATSVPQVPGAPATVEFADRPDGIVFCQGLESGGVVLTARHCVEDFRTHPAVAYRLRGGLWHELDKARVDATAATSFASQAASFVSDFATFRLEGDAPLAPDPGLLGLASPPSRGMKVVVERGNGRDLSCHVEAVCGSSLHYSCHPSTSPGWSGSPVWTAATPRRLVGIHTGQSDAEGIASATSMLTVIARSGAFFDSDAAFSNAVARGPAFAHHWDRNCAAIDPKSVAGPLPVQALPRPGTLHGMVALPGGGIVAADLDRRSTCAIGMARDWSNWRCAPDRSTYAARVNGFEDLGSGRVAIAESEVDVNRAPYGSTAADLTGGVGFATLDNGPSGPRLSRYARAPARVGTVIALRRFGLDLLAGGSEGLCVAKLAGGECRTICARATCGPGDPWRVNGILRLDDDHALVVGADHRDGRYVPAFKLYARQATGWVQAAVGAVGPDLARSTRELASRRGGLHLKAPVRFDGQILAFGSDGVAYRIDGARIVQRVPMRGLARSDSDDRDASRDVLEDAVRDAIVLPTGVLAVASDDGTVRFFDGGWASGRFELRSRTDSTIYDRGAWVTEMLVAGTNLFVRAQDGTITRIDLAGAASAMTTAATGRARPEP